MSTRGFSIAALATSWMLLLASQVAAQISIPTKAHETLSFELQSLRDNITLFRGDPQLLLSMNVRPDRFRPRVEYTSQAQAVLRIRDLYISDHPQFSDLTAAERDEEEDAPYTEEWEIRLSPAGPTDFSMFCERGEGTFDFTDLEVRSVDLRAEGTKVDVDFSSQNPIELESFVARVPTGSFQFHHMINARAKEIRLHLPGSTCQFEVTGKQFEGESMAYFEGVPAEMQMLVSRKVGLRVTGPAATIARFEAPHMTREGEDLVSQGYAAAKCHIRLTFAAEIPKLNVEWQ